MTSPPQSTVRMQGSKYLQDAKRKEKEKDKDIEKDLDMYYI